MPDVAVDGLIDNRFSPFRTPVQQPSNFSRYERSPVANYVYQLYDIAKRHRDIVSQRWDECYSFFRGKQLRLPAYYRNQDNWRAVIQVNHILANIETITAVLLDSSPKIDVSPRHPDQQAYVSTLQTILDALWKRRKSLLRLEDAVKSSMIYGTGFLKVFWNQLLENGLGDVDIEHLATEYGFPDPEAKDFDDSMRFFFESKPVSMSYIKERWPQLAHCVRADAQAPDQDKSRRTVDGMTSLPSLFWLTPQGDNPQRGDQTEYSSPPYKRVGFEENWVTLHELWVRDSFKEIVTELVMSTDQAGQPILVQRQMEVPKYPNGRIIHVAGGVVLDDAPVECPMWPYVKFTDISVPSEFYGIGEVELLRDLQIEHNRRRSMMADYSTNMGNPIWMVDENSNVKRDQLGNRPNMVVFKAAGSRVERISPPQMPSWMPMMADKAAGDMQYLSGTAGASSGVPPRGARTGAAFAEANQIQTLRIRSRARSVEIGVEQVGRIAVALIQRYYTVPRVVRVVGAVGYGPPGATPAGPPIGGGQVYWVPYDGRNLRGDWDLNIQAGSMSSTTKAAERQEYFQLYQVRAIDARALLEKWGIPNYEAILARMGQPGPITVQNQYPGFPGRPNPGPSGITGYSASVRLQPTAPPPPMGGGGQQYFQGQMATQGAGGSSPTGPKPNPFAGGF